MHIDEFLMGYFTFPGLKDSRGYQNQPTTAIEKNLRSYIHLKQTSAKKGEQYAWE